MTNKLKYLLKLMHSSKLCYSSEVSFRKNGSMTFLTHLTYCKQELNQIGMYFAKPRAMLRDESINNSFWEAAGSKAECMEVTNDPN